MSSLRDRRRARDDRRKVNDARDGAHAGAAVRGVEQRVLAVYIAFHVRGTRSAAGQPFDGEDHAIVRLTELQLVANASANLEAVVVARVETDIVQRARP